ncbi:hypothetical protein ACFZDK_26475 [Streptomyces sp. NPDC007901]|uniref:hypothetical protein n=1 Tax=Streptomyces sp. NPDC007901 TaxID=3364785 RepID=UPI0036E4D446
MRTGTLAVQLYSVIDALAADRPGTLARLAGLGYRHVEPFALGMWNTSPDELAAFAAELRADLDAAGLGVSSVHVAGRQSGIRDRGLPHPRHGHRVRPCPMARRRIRRTGV